ncbi:MAG TPA: ABC transporter permease subunit [Candidatus Limnocylindria bacterium]
MPRRDPWAYIGLAAFFALLFFALFGERIAPHQAIFFVPEHDHDPRPYDPGLVFPLGSDVLGRDLFSLVLIGARTTLTVVLLGGLARVAAGLALAGISTWSRPLRAGTDWLADLVSAVPATLVALIAVKVLVKGDTSVFMFIGALLITGWAGPYRVIRAELDRLAHMPFMEGVRALGVSRSDILRRHHLPHLVPVLALNTSQQVVASLVLVAELGVLGAFIGSVRGINIEESLNTFILGQLNSAQIADPPEWGGLLASTNARAISTLWTTRWLFLVPGVAFALTAVAVAAIGFAVARRYARRNVLEELRTRGAGALALTVAAIFIVSALVPDRYAAARSWADDARRAVVATGDSERAFADAGLAPLGGSFALERDTTQVVEAAPATVTVGGVTETETPAVPRSLEPVVYSRTGGGVVEARVVFVSRGLSPADYPPQQTSVFAGPDLGTLIKDLPDDYEGIDVRGKIVVLVRLAGVAAGSRTVSGPAVDTLIENALKRGAAAILFVDPILSRYADVATSISIPVNPYRRLEASDPVSDPNGTPVVVVTPAIADRLLAPAGLSTAPFATVLDAGSADARRSASRDLGITARVSVPLVRATAHVRTIAGETPGVPIDAGRVVVWAVRRSGGASAVDVLGALARTLTPRRVPFVFVDFDPAVDANTNARAVATALAGRRVALMLVIDGLDGARLSFDTPYGDLVPAIDTYAQKAGARYVVTRGTESITSWSWPGIAPFISTKTILIGATGGQGDLRADAAALVAYVAGRYALGAEELPR